MQMRLPKIKEKSQKNTFFCPAVLQQDGVFMFSGQSFRWRPEFFSAGIRLKVMSLILLFLFIS